MIDHVSVAVRDLARSAAFYERLLAPLGYTRLVERPASIGFGKKYPELWLNLRADMSAAPTNPGSHVALRASSEERRARLPRRGVGGGRCERGRAGTQAGGDDDLLRRLRARPRRQQAGSDVVPGGVAGFYAAANTNPVERLDRAIRRRTNIVSIFPNEAAIVRFIDAIPLEQNDPSLSRSQGHLRPVGGLPYSVVFPSKCASVAWASARVARAMPSRCSGGA